MQLLTIDQVAQRANRSPHTVQKWASSGKLPGRKIGGTWVITNEELQAYLNGHEPPTNNVYDLKGAADYLGITQAVARRLVREGHLKGTTIDNRGRYGGTRAFTEIELDQLTLKLEELLDVRPGPKVKGDPDKHIKHDHKTGKWAVIGTKNHKGCPYAYSFQFDARARAREAFDSPPVYKAGDQVYVLPHDPEKFSAFLDEGNRTWRMFIAEDVTPVDKTVLVQPRWDNGEQEAADELTDGEPMTMLVSIRDIVGPVSD